MESQYENGTLRITLSGVLDSTNASEVQEELFAVLDACEKEHGRPALLIDMEHLDYTSSIGLRALLLLRRRVDHGRIINANSVVYDILSVTGFTDVYEVEKQYRSISIDGCPIIGQGAKGTVYRYNDDTIVKVYKNPDSLPEIRKEREYARRAFVLGVPTAITFDIVRVGDGYGTLFELLNADTYSFLFRDDPDNLDRYIDEYASLLRKIHATQVEKEDFPSIKVFIREWLKTDEPYLSPASFAKLSRLINELPEPCAMLHCDYHSNNVMRQNGEPILIDMDTLCYGHPIAELANIYISFIGFGEVNSSIVEQFLGFPYATARQVWKRFLPAYLQTDDKARIEEVERKARLLAYTRLLRHTVRRSGKDTAEGRATLALCIKGIDELLRTTDTLTF